MAFLDLGCIVITSGFLLMLITLSAIEDSIKFVNISIPILYMYSKIIYIHMAHRCHNMIILHNVCICNPWGVSVVADPFYDLSRLFRQR